MAIKILSDSTSYIDTETQKELDIELFPLTVHFPDESFKETEVDYDYFYRKIEKTGIIPTSSQPTPGDIYEKFYSLAEQGHDIMAIFISSAMSGTYSTAVAAREQVLEKFPAAKIVIFDSYTNCMALGLQVIAAAHQVKTGGSLESVIKAAEHIRECVHFYFVPETLEYLKKGGRMGTASALLGTILNIRPILTVDMKKGMTHLYEKARGTSAAIKRMLQLIEEDNRKYGLEEIIVHHINAPEKAKGIRDSLQERYGKPVRICSIGPVIGLHTGLGTVGFVYSTERV
ncbi:MAG: DegV family protein [Syntrophomonadaceae bacterium]|nr:DegV family protein [Syntrophomonadaceae bacterium]